MNNTTNEIYKIIKSIFVALITNVILDLYKNEFHILKINLNSLISTFMEYWWLILIIFILALIRFKMHETPNKKNYKDPDAKFIGSGPILHNGRIWEIVVEEINPFMNLNNKSNIHYYVNAPLCHNKLNDNELCFSELYLKDIGFCYLEKCDNCSFKRLTLKSYGQEASEILTKIDALIRRQRGKIEDCHDLIELLKQKWDL